MARGTQVTRRVVDLWMRQKVGMLSGAEYGSRLKQLTPDELIEYGSLLKRIEASAKRIQLIEKIRGKAREYYLKHPERIPSDHKHSDHWILFGLVAKADASAIARHITGDSHDLSKSDRIRKIVEQLAHPTLPLIDPLLGTITIRKE